MPSQVQTIISAGVSGWQQPPYPRWRDASGYVLSPLERIGAIRSMVAAYLPLLSAASQPGIGAARHSQVPMSIEGFPPLLRSPFPPANIGTARDPAFMV